MSTLFLMVLALFLCTCAYKPAILENEVDGDGVGNKQTTLTQLLLLPFRPDFPFSSHLSLFFLCECLLTFCDITVVLIYTKAKELQPRAWS